MKINDTIYALSTTNGKSAIAIYRLSGPNCFKIIKRISNLKNIKPNRPTLAKIYADKEKTKQIDKCLIKLNSAPQSYTGEDTLELSIHGGKSIITGVNSALKETKLCRIALAGEFTRRAYDNNKLDLTQVEAIADLINAETEAQRTLAISHLEGRFSKEVKKATTKITKIQANLEALIDFSEDEVPKNTLKETKEQIENIIVTLNKLINDNNIGEKIREGFDVVILGKPNVGKSSLINYIAKKELAIVSKIPGTTRDIVSLYYNLEGLPVIFKDTAGIRKSTGIIEKKGVEKAVKASSQSAVNLVILQKKSEIRYYEKKFENTILCKSKYDIPGKKNKLKGVINFSSKNGHNIDFILKKIYRKLVKRGLLTNNVLISRERHRICLENCIKSLKKAKKSKQIDIMAEESRESLKNISQIVGKYDIENVLDIIFSDFCIGK